MKRFVPVLAALALAACGEAEQKESIVVVSWGGAYTKSQTEAYHKPYAAKTGVEIKSVDYNGGIAEVKAQSDSGNVSWDIVDFEVADAMRACDEGLLEKLDPNDLPAGADGTPAMQDFVPGGATDCYVATIVFSTVIAYDKTRFAQNPPTKAADFFDLVNFPGKRGLRRQNPKATLELALLADGVAPADIYAVLSTKEGLDRAFAKLDSIKSQVVWWEAGSQPPQLLADGEVVMTTSYNGRIFDAQVVDQKPFGVIWDGEMMDLDVWGIVKGAPHRDRAWDFLKFSTDTQRLADQARWIAYSPARKSSLPLVSTHAERGVEMMPYMPTAPENMTNAVYLDHRWWADRQDEINQRWNAWLAR